MLSTIPLPEPEARISGFCLNSRLVQIALLFSLRNKPVNMCAHHLPRSSVQISFWRLCEVSDKYAMFLKFIIKGHYYNQQCGIFNDLTHIFFRCVKKTNPSVLVTDLSLPQSFHPAGKQLRNGGECRGWRKNLDTKQSSQSSSLP